MTTSNLPSTTESPLAEADPYSIDALMSMDPLKLTDDDVIKIVHELRLRRAQWEEEESGARKDSKRPNSRKVAKPSIKLTAEDINIDLDDIEI